MRSIIISVCCFCMCVVGAFAEGEESSQLQKQMLAAYKAYEKLQPYMSSKPRFLDPAKHQEILESLTMLSNTFSEAAEAKAKFSQQPGFAATLAFVTSDLEDVRQRFVEGKKEYALWRLRKVDNYCATCHTSYAVDVKFTDNSKVTDGLQAMKKAEFFLATRQYDKASEEFFAVAQDENSSSKLEAVRKWLLVQIRVEKSPIETLRALQVLLKQRTWLRFEREELISYQSALIRWANEEENSVSKLRRAENLIRQGLTPIDPLRSEIGAVELLRATALLHGLLEQNGNLSTQERAKALYLLGLSYAKLPLFAADELSNFFFEQCIRENPDSKTARRCYRVYSNEIYLSYTGSGGTHVPTEVQDHLHKLYEIAYD